MKTNSLVMVLFLCAYCCSAQRGPARKQAAASFDKSEKDAVAYVKAIDVKKLDPSLPSRGLEDWLKSGPPHLDVMNWRLDETCDNHPDLESDYPRCVRLDFRRGGHDGYFLILIGTLKKGILGPPRLYYGIDVVEEGFVQAGFADRLSELPKVLDKPLISTPVTDLYEKVIALHPKGIPDGTDKATIWPFLSGRFIQQFETARACQDDYARQHPMGDADPKPTWIKSGVFFGYDQRATPSFINTGATELQKDGSYRVSMSAYVRNKTGKDRYIVAGGIRAYSFAPDAQWLMVATVVPESDRFVVDDVRIFDENSADSPSYLLSETFAGCDGTQWSGEHVEKKPPAVAAPEHYTDWDAVNTLRKSAYDEEVAFGKALDVRELDPSLPSQRFEDWLRSASLHVNHIEWYAGGCNIKEGRDGATREPEGRLCAGVRFQRRSARAHIDVGTFVNGSLGPPEVTYIGVQDKDDGLLTPVSTDGKIKEVPDSVRLSELPRLLDEEAVIDVTRTLYDGVVAHHPLGIPKGQDKVGTSPLLSKRLRAQLETAQACQADYLRQNPSHTGMPKPAWFKAGLFSGDGALASPGADLVDLKERQADGSFQVLVWLSHEDSAVTDSAPPTSRWRTWRVSTLVKSEDNRFVVDDVRLFGDDSIDSQSRLLSNSFTGCDGSRWAGIGSTIK